MNIDKEKLRDIEARNTSLDKECGRLEREIDRLRAELQARQWQPIETAPKDSRTLLLGYFNSHGKWRTVRGQWMSEDYIAEYWEDPDDVEPGWFETSVEADDPPNCWRIEPTHWMPLPPAPPQGGIEVYEIGASIEGVAALDERNTRDALLKACRRAVLALAAAAHYDPSFKADYEVLSEAIAQQGKEK